LLRADRCSRCIRVNRDDLPFRPISGLVDADLFHDGGINFPAAFFLVYCPREHR
jgi:hypothetical protein